MTLNEWKNKPKYFDYKGHQISYWEEGTGPTLLLIHGFPTSSWDWHKMWQQLTSQFRVIAIDMIGFGLSDKPKHYNYSITDQARLHEAFLIEKNIQAIHMLVHDYGVSVAQEMLAAFQEKREKSFQILSCCFLNGGLFPELHRAKLVQKILNSPIGSLFNRFLSKQSLRKSFDDVYGERKATEQEIDEFYELIVHNGGKQITHLLIKYINDRRENGVRWKAALTESIIPLHFINGPLDPVSGRHLAQYCKELLPQYKVDILEGIGHYPHDEAPEKVLQMYLDFYSRVIKI